MSWLASMVNPVFSRASSLTNSTLFTGTATFAGAGIAAESIASTAHHTVVNSVAQIHGLDIPLSESHAPAPQTAKLQSDEHRYYNTIESLSQYNSKTSGVHKPSGRFFNLVPDHVIDGVSAGLSKAFGGTPEIKNAEQSSLAYQFRSKEWENLTHSLALVGQGIAAVALPYAASLGVVKAAQFLKAGSLETFASHWATQGVGQVAAAALIANVSPAPALPNSSIRKRGITAKEVVIEPIKKTERVVQSWDLGNNETGQRYREGWLDGAMKEVNNPTGFAAVTIPIALSLAEKVTRAEAFDVVKNRKPGQPLVVTPFPELDIVKAFAKKNL